MLDIKLCDICKKEIDGISIRFNYKTCINCYENNFDDDDYESDGSDEEYYQRKQEKFNSECSDDSEDDYEYPPFNNSRYP